MLTFIDLLTKCIQGPILLLFPYFPSVSFFPFFHLLSQEHPTSIEASNKISISRNSTSQNPVKPTTILYHFSSSTNPKQKPVRSVAKILGATTTHRCFLSHFSSKSGQSWRFRAWGFVSPLKGVTSRNIKSRVEGLKV